MSIFYANSLLSDLNFHNLHVLLTEVPDRFYYIGFSSQCLKQDIADHCLRAYLSQQGPG